MFILVSTPHSIFAAHGHKLLIISPIIEGLCGGWATLQAATSAYVSDCTSDGSRASIFSRFTGVFYFGFAIGPTIGAALIRHPFIPIFSPAVGVHNGAPTVTSVFYVAALASFINLMLALFLFPESLGKKKAQVVTSSSLAATPPVEEEPLNAVQQVLSALRVFLPKVVTSPNGTKHKDWSMMLLAIVLFGHLLSLVGVVPQYEPLITSHAFRLGCIPTQIPLRRAYLWLGRRTGQSLFHDHGTGIR